MEVRWQYRRLKYDENEKTDMGGKKLFFVFCACGDGGRRGARREVSNLQSSYVKKENFVLAEFLSLLKGQKKFAAFYDESAINAHCFPCECIPYRPIPIKVMINMIRDCP